MAQVCSEWSHHKVAAEKQFWRICVSGQLSFSQVVLNVIKITMALSIGKRDIQSVEMIFDVVVHVGDYRRALLQ